MGDHEGRDLVGLGTPEAPVPKLGEEFLVNYRPDFGRRVGFVRHILCPGGQGRRSLAQAGVKFVDLRMHSQGHGIYAPQVQAAQAAHPAQGDVAHSGRKGLAEVDFGGIQAHALALVDGDGPGQPQR